MIRGKLSQLMVRVESNQGSTLLVTYAIDISIIAHDIPIMLKPRINLIESPCASYAQKIFQWIHG